MYIFREKHLSMYFKEYGNYSLYITLSNDKISCKKAMLLNNPYDSNIRKFLVQICLIFALLLWQL